MANIYRRIAGVGSGIGAESGALIPPAQPQIISVRVLDTAPGGTVGAGRRRSGPSGSSGVRKKRVTITYQPPTPLGTFKGVWVYLDAPDSFETTFIADGTVPADGTNPAGGVFNPTDMGYFGPPRGGFGSVPLQVSFDVDAPSQPERWRVYVIGVSDVRRPPVVAAGEPDESVSRQFVCLPLTSTYAGREFAPLVQSQRFISYVDLGWPSNPQQVQLESGDQVFQVGVQWEWPTGDQNFGVLGGVNIVLYEQGIGGDTQVYAGPVYVSQEAKWISAQLPLRPGTTNYTVFLESFDTQARRNSQVAGFTPSVSFTVTRELGVQGQEYAALVTQHGSDPFVSTTAVHGNDGTAFLRVTANWQRPDDPQFGGVIVYVKRPSEDWVPLFGGHISPIEKDIPNPITVQTWRFALVSVDTNNRSNQIKDNGDGTHNAGETPWVDISVGNPDGQLDLSMGRLGTYSDQFTLSLGYLQLKEVEAELIISGRLQVGGPGMVSQMKIFDTLGSLVGWVGDDTAVSGYEGAWFKQLRVGGASPSSAGFVADASGNLTISGTLIAGAVALATDASHVPSSGIVGSIVASQIGSVNTSSFVGTITSGQIASVSASTITGSIVASQIGSVNTSALVGSITAGQITSITAGQITGSITSGQIGSVAASTITGTLVSTQIASVAATTITGTLTAAQIGSVNTSSFVGSITAGQITSLTAGQITGVVISSQLADGIIDSLGKFAAATRPVQQVSTIPTLPSNNFLAGTFFYYTVDKHFYKIDSGGTTYTDQGTDPDSLTGALKLYHIGSLNAQNITGLILAAQISTVNATSIVGSITSGQIGSVAASTITGSITSSQITSVSASTITGTLTSTQIGSINAATITIGLIGDSQIGAISAGKLTAGTVSASVTMTSPTLVISSGTVTVNIDASHFIKLTDTSTDSIASVVSGGFFVGSIASPSRNSLYGNGSLYFQDASGFPIVELTNTPRLRLYGASAATKVDLGILGGNGYLAFNGGSNYALWTNSNAKKLIAGSGTFSAGQYTVSTGFSSITSAVANIVAVSGVSESVSVVDAGGGSVTFSSSNGTSAAPFSYMVFGTP